MLIEEGYKFETLCMMPAIWAETSRDYLENRENEIVNNHAQYCSVVKTGIGNTVMILGGEVDAGKFSFCICGMTLTCTSMGFKADRR
jgi:RAT1-interacting protein